MEEEEEEKGGKRGTRTTRRRRRACTAHSFGCSALLVLFVRFTVLIYLLICSLNPELMLMIRCLNDLVLSHISLIHFLSNVKHIGKIILFKLKMYDQSAYPLAIAGRVGATFFARRTFSFHLFESAVNPSHIG